MHQKGGWVYIISNKRRTVLYTGSTTDIKRRMKEHRTGFFESFSKKFNCSDLLYYEFFTHIADAAARERQIKAWKREWKIELIKKENPGMIDLAEDWFDEKGNLKNDKE